MTRKVSGYTRALFDGEQIDLDMAELRRAGVLEVIADPPGVARPRLVAWIDQAKPEDTLVFTSLERIAGSVNDIVRILVLLSGRGVEWRCLSHPELHRAGLDVLRVLDDAQRRIIANATRAGR